MATAQPKTAPTTADRPINPSCRPAEPRQGEVLWVQVEKVLPGYVCVRLPSGLPGIIERRELSLEQDVDPRFLVHSGQWLLAKVIGPSESGRSIALSHRQTLPDPWDRFVAAYQVGDVVSGRVTELFTYGVAVEIVPGVNGLIPKQELAPWPVNNVAEVLQVGDAVEAEITAIRPMIRQVDLSLWRRVLRLRRSYRWSEQLGIREDRCIMDSRPEQELHRAREVLVIEDNPDFATSLAQTLQEAGWSVRWLSSFQAALQGLDNLARNELPPRVFLVDLDLGDGSGITLVRRLRKQFPGIPVALLSTPDRLRQARNALKDLSGIWTFAKTPFQPSDLIEWLGTPNIVLDPLHRRSWPGPQPSHGQKNAGDRELGGTGVASTHSRAEGGVAAERRNLRRLLAVLCRTTQAQVALVACYAPQADRVELLAYRGEVPTDEEALYLLARSPVGDVIREGKTLLEGRAATGRRAAYFANLLRVLPFESCIGIQIRGAYGVPHGLFLFHRDPERFGKRHVRRALTTAASIAAALDRMAFARQLQTVNRHVLAGRLAASLGHELANQVGGLGTSVQNLRHALGANDLEAVRRAVADLEIHQHTLDKLLLGFWDMVGRSDGTRAEDDQVSVEILVARLRCVLKALAAQAEARFTDPVISRGARELQVAGSATAVQQILFNLGLNAVQHISTLQPDDEGWRGRVSCYVDVVYRDDEPWLVFQVEDTGPGIHAVHQGRIFQPGFTTRPGGSGLGLYISQTLAEALGGRLYLVESVPYVRTVFRLEVPAEPASPGILGLEAGDGRESAATVASKCADEDVATLEHVSCAGC